MRKTFFSYDIWDEIDLNHNSCEVYIMPAHLDKWLESLLRRMNTVKDLTLLLTLVRTWTKKLNATLALGLKGC